MGMKDGMGASTEHPMNKQDSNGPGAKPKDWKKTSVNPSPPNVDEGKAHSQGKPRMAPDAKALSGGKKPAGNVAIVDAKPAGKSKTFRAPRSGGGESAVECGYTRPGKM